MKVHPFRRVLFVILVNSCFPLFLSNDGPRYDSSAYTECKIYPEAPLYNGGIFNDSGPKVQGRSRNSETSVYSPAYVIQNLIQDYKYSFSGWVKIKGADTALINARLSIDNTDNHCVGTVLARRRCWSFLKGGFVPERSSSFSVLFFQSSDKSAIEITVASLSLQPFTDQEWRMQQEERIRTKRKRRVTIHVSDGQGNRLPGALLAVKQTSKDFPFGSAMAKTIIGNLPYQAWFLKRFNAAVFENELKWYVTEPERGRINYTLADQMLGFVRANRVSTVRGHNIFWEDPTYTPAWVRNLTGQELLTAVNSRIESLMYKYRGEFVHWDVSNEMLHFDFYESRLGPNASSYFFDTAQGSDPWATLFMNEFNVVETCEDVNSTVDTYVGRLRELRKGGAILEGIGLEGHFTRPNIPLMRATLDKLATLELPVWLTEVDISKIFDMQTQAIYLEEVLREGFSHPSVDGIMLWTALHPNGCYQMCLTDYNLHNLPAGDVVDKLLQEWETIEIGGQTDEHGSYSFEGFLGEYQICANYGTKSVNSTLSLCQGDETLHFNLQL